MSYLRSQRPWPHLSTTWCVSHVPFALLDAHELVKQPLVLINRFMINLRTADSEMSDHSVPVTDQQRQSTVQFRRSTNRLGNIGEMLQNGWDDDELLDEGNCAAGVNEAGRGEASAGEL